jgi:hypothetical protein
MNLPTMLVTSLLLVGNVVATDDHRTQAQLASFPTVGHVSITATVKQGENPTIRFRSELSKNLLLQAELGGKDWREFRAQDDPDAIDQSIAFVVLHRNGLPDPLIAILVKRAGGSDCSYLPALFGESNSTIHQLTPLLPGFLTRGKVLLSSSATGHPATLTIASERYDWKKDVHYTGPSRMATFVYTYNPVLGRFIKTSSREIKTEDMKLSGEDLMKLFGDFPNC